MSDDDSIRGSVFDGESSDFARPVKAAKPKVAPKKAAGTGKSRGRPPADPTRAKPKPKAAPKKKRKDDSDDENSDIDMDANPLDDDESLLVDTPPQQKKALGPKKTSGKPLTDIANESFGMDGASELPVMKTKKATGGVTDRYQMVGAILVETLALADPLLAYTP